MFDACAFKLCIQLLPLTTGVFLRECYTISYSGKILILPFAMLSMSCDYRYSGRVGEHVASIITLAVASLPNLTGVSSNIFHPIIAASRSSAVMI